MPHGGIFVLAIPHAITHGLAYVCAIAAGTAVRFEPGQTRTVELVAFAGERKVYGFRGEVMGSL